MAWFQATESPWHGHLLFHSQRWQTSPWSAATSPARCPHRPVPASPLPSSRACPVPCALPHVRDPSGPSPGWRAEVGPPQLMLDAGILIPPPLRAGTPHRILTFPRAGIPSRSPSGPSHGHWVRQAFPVQRGSGHSQPCRGRWGAWGEPPVSGASTPGQEEPSLSLQLCCPPSPSLAVRWARAGNC